MKKKYKRILLAAFAAAAVFAVGVSRMMPAAVEVEEVMKADLNRSFTVQADIEPETSRILNADAAGIVETAPFLAGTECREGEILFQTADAGDTSMRLQAEQMNAALSAAKQEYERLYGKNGLAQSELSVAKSAYELAEKKYQSGKALADAGGYIAQAELDELKSFRDTAKEQYNQAMEAASDASKQARAEQIASLESQLELLREGTAAGEVKMPFDGILWEVYVNSGSFVSAHQPVARVYKADSLRLHASLLSEDAVKLHEGDTAMVVYGDGTKGSALVTFISKTAEKELSSIGLSESRSTVILMPKELPGNAGAGQQADVNFSVLLSADTITVPSTALVPDGGRDVVYVIKNKKACKVSVETGVRESGRVEITSGLSDGDQVISNPFDASVRDGMRVKVLSEP